MRQVKKTPYTELISLIGHTVRFTSDCEMFPHFDVSARVYDISVRDGNEYMFHTVEQSRHKRLIIGSNMRNLSYEILK